MTDLTAVRDLLASTNPAPEGDLADAADGPNARALLATILASSRDDPAPDTPPRLPAQRRGTVAAGLPPPRLPRC